jgi:hypothetical protein
VARACHPVLRLVRACSRVTPVRLASLVSDSYTMSERSMTLRNHPEPRRGASRVTPATRHQPNKIDPPPPVGGRTPEDLTNRNRCPRSRLRVPRSPRHPPRATHPARPMPPRFVTHPASPTPRDPLRATHPARPMPHDPPGAPSAAPATTGAPPTAPAVARPAGARPALGRHEPEGATTSHPIDASLRRVSAPMLSVGRCLSRTPGRSGRMPASGEGPASGAGPRNRVGLGPRHGRPRRQRPVPSRPLRRPARHQPCS